MPHTFPDHCPACHGTGLHPNGEDACEHCTYWVDGEPCQTREQVLAVLRDYAAHGVLDEVSYAVRDFQPTPAELGLH
jgi:hypothetical protein